MLLRNCSTNAVIASEIDIASTSLRRCIGLLVRSKVAPHEGMWFPNSSVIHTIGMRAPIDVIFLDGEDRVVKFAADIRPNKPFVGCLGAKTVIELGAGALERTDLLLGDRLALEPC